MNATPGETVDTSGIDISEHAKLHASERLGVVTGVAEHVRGLLDRAEPVDVDYVRNAKAYQAGGITLVVSNDGEIVQTLFEKGVRE